MQKFKTSYALWIVLSVILFLLACFIPRLVTDEGNLFTEVRVLFAYRFYWQTVLGVFCIGVAAAVIGWVLQALLIVWKNRKKIDRHVA